MKIPDPFSTLKKTYSDIPVQIKAAFFSTFVFGLMAHLYQFTNKLFNFDELYNTPEGTGEGLGLGRFGLFYVGRFIKHFFGNYSLPLINGLVSLLLIAIAACLIVSALKIENTLLAALTGGLMAVFPSVTCNFFFLFTSPYYSFALMLACLSPFILLKRKNILNFLIASFILAFSTGIYQAYFAVGAVFILTALILKTMDILNGNISSEKKISSAELFKEALYCLFWLIASLVMYMLINKISLKVFNVTLPEYQGLSSMGTIDPAFILKRGLETYAHTVHLFMTDVYRLNPTSVIKTAMLVLFIVTLYIIILTLKKGIKNKTEAFTLILFLAFLIVFPIALFLVFLMVTPETYVQAAMLNSVVFSVIMPLSVLDRYLKGTEKGEEERTGLLNLSGWLSILASTGIILVYIWYANGNYLALQYSNFHDLSYYNIIVSQIKGTEGYTDDTPVIILGSHYIDNSFTAGNLMGSTFSLYGTPDTNIGAYSNNNLFTKYLGFTPEFLWSDEDELRFNNDERVKEMPCYPDEGSIQMIDGVIVVKVEECPEPETP